MVPKELELKKVYPARIVAELFNVSVKTIYYWVRKGKMKYSLTPGGGICFTIQDIDSSLASIEKEPFKDLDIERELRKPKGKRSRAILNIVN